MKAGGFYGLLQIHKVLKISRDSSNLQGYFLTLF